MNDLTEFEKRIKWRKSKENIFKLISLVATYSCILLLFVLVFDLFMDGKEWLGLKFLTNFQSRFPHKAGIYAGLMGTLWLTITTALISIPLGVLAGIFLEEYGIPGKIGKIIEINISNLAGVPSIVYGLLGLSVFVRGAQMGRSIIAGALTLGLLILPVIIVATRESLKAVPLSLRMAGYALGARKYQVTFGQVLPSALPGILTGIILAIGRAIGETAPLVVIGALSYVSFVPASVKDEFTVLPIMIYNWASRPQEAFHGLASAGILVLLIVMLCLNGLAIYFRIKNQKGKRS